MVETAGSAQRCVFTEVQDAKLGELLRSIFDEVTEDGLIVVANQDDFVDIGDFRKGLEAMVDNWMPGDFKKRL
jgi:hypothetical protein